MSTTTEITAYARFLRNANPQAFVDFIAAFAKYSDAMTKHLVDATENLPVAQGRAQQCVKILKALEEANG